MCIRDSLTVSIAMTLLAVLCWQKLPSPAPGWALLAVLVALGVATRSRTRAAA